MIQTFAISNGQEFVLAIIGMGIGGGIIMSFLGMLTKAFGRRERKDDPEETRLIQELHQIATKLEGRVESLETLIVDRERKLSDEKPGHE